MAKTVRDILVNVDSGDLQFSAGNMSSHPFFELVWGSLFNTDNPNILYANVIIPQRKLNKLVKDEQDRCIIYAKATYCPYDKPFTVRLVKLNSSGSYQELLQSEYEYPIISLAYLPNDEHERVKASELPEINIDGNILFKLEFGETDNIAYVYTADSTDFLVGGSDLQSSQLLAICEPGKHYRYPTTGIGATNYIGSVVSHTDLGDKIIEQFKNNGISVQDANFDAKTGELQVIFFNEEIEEEQGNLRIDELNIDDANVSDAILDEIAAEINLDDDDIDYDALIFNIETPGSSLESCFANGIWIGEWPWTGGELWKGQE